MSQGTYCTLHKHCTVHCTVLCTHCTVLVGKSSTRLDVEDVAEDLVVALLQPLVHLAQLVRRDQLHVEFNNFYFCSLQGGSASDLFLYVSFDQAREPWRNIKFTSR
jgi:hypothetical protein